MGPAGIPPGQSAGALQRLARELELRRNREATAERAERRHFEAMGLDYGAVQAARAAEARKALQRAMDARRMPEQLVIPGIDPRLMSLLTALRYRGNPSPAEAMAAGVVGLRGFQRLPEPVGDQLEIDFSVRPGQGNRIVAFSRPAPGPAPGPTPLRARAAGSVLMDALLPLALGSGLGLGITAEVRDPDGSQF